MSSVNTYISGFGDVNAKNLISDKSKVKIAGSGNVYLNTKEELNATVLGSGSVRYKGSPKVITNKVGSGSVAKM
ncbi:GIN domain-containing protein [Pedobacter psychrophilus]|uniref:GIN domain-containing protein n=1 Tax=Pedobacter psychrophilus TaxID=1826909 RepID=UPI00373FC90E